MRGCGRQECLDAGLDEVQRGICTYNERSPEQRRLASLEAWTCIIGRALKKKNNNQRGNGLVRKGSGTLPDPKGQAEPQRTPIFSGFSPTYAYTFDVNQ